MFITKKKHLEPGYCEYDDFESSIKYCDANLTVDQYDYVNMKIF
jgi:hypothetical protein